MDSAHPVRLYVRDPRTKRLKVAFDIIDESVPYVRRLLGDFVEADAGPWADLAPDLPALPGPEDDAVTLLRRHARDGEVRALLMDLGIAKADWETASPSTREAVIAFVHASQLTDAAIVAALTDPDMRLRDSAVRLLGKLNHLLENERNIFNNKGFGAFAFKASMLARAQRVVAVITDRFRQAKEEAREAKKKEGLFCSTRGFPSADGGPRRETTDVRRRASLPSGPSLATALHNAPPRYGQGRDGQRGGRGGRWRGSGWRSCWSGCWG